MMVSTYLCIRRHDSTTHWPLNYIACMDARGVSEGHTYMLGEYFEKWCSYIVVYSQSTDISVDSLHCTTCQLVASPDAKRGMRKT